MGNGSNVQVVGFSSIEMGSGEGKSSVELRDESVSNSVLTKRSMFSMKEVGESFGRREMWRRVMKSIKIALLSDKINLLIPCGPLAMLVDHLTNHHVSYLHRYRWLGLLLELIRQLAFYTGPTVGGLLNATFGNATELIISMYAMKHGMLRVVQQSLLGSILSNMLLVLGCAFFCGGIVHPHKPQVFNKSNAVMSSGLLLMAVMGLLFPTVLHFTHTELHFGSSELALSRFSSCIMLIAYGAYLFFQLTGQENSYSPITEEAIPDNDNSDDDESPDISKCESIIWLSILTLTISVLSEYLVNTIEGASIALNIPIAFISVILLPIVGNAAEHASAIIFAIKDKLDISLGVAIGSSTQISMFAVDAHY
ncbi:vacuolar cation/proton exchanger 3-like protein [Tanacetum coccineum]